MTTVLEVSPISPPAGAACELMVPLAFFDYSWLHFHPIRHLLFYNFPCSEPFFLSTLLPKLKESLSLTLSHYLLVAGNLLYPSDPHQKKPVLRYRPGDSVSLTVAVSPNDFDELTGNHARDSDQFYDFVPPMPPPPVADDPEYKIVPLMALQVTLFPGRGVCLGLSLHHSLGDARSILGFMSAWASINKHGEHYSLPIFDRSVIQDTYGIDTIFWDDQRCIPFDPSSSFPTPTGRVRARFILRHADIKKLKELVLAKREVDVSSFVVTTAYVWSCLAKAKAIPDDETELLFFTADARRLISPAVRKTTLAIA